MQKNYVLKSEDDVSRTSVVEAAKLGVPLWRNNKGAMIDANGRLVRYGLGHISKQLDKVWKSSDYIGIFPGGIFGAVEFKPPGWVYSPKDEHVRAQWAFLAQCISLGGVGMFVTDPRQIVEKIMAMRAVLMAKFKSGL